MAVNPLLAAAQGVAQGLGNYQQMSQNPLAAAKFQLQADNAVQNRQYMQQQQDLMGVQQQAAEMNLAAGQRGEAQRRFSELDMLAQESGGYANALRTPGGNAMMIGALHAHPQAAEFGADSIEGFDVMDADEALRRGFSEQEINEMMPPGGATSFIIPYRMEGGRKVPVLEDLDGDGSIRPYTEDDIARLVRPMFMNQGRAGDAFGQLLPEEAPGGVATRGGGGAPGQQGAASTDSGAGFQLGTRGLDMGAMSAQYESGDAGVGAIFENDIGGAPSYGTYQLSSAKGTMQKWLAQEGAEFAQLLPADSTSQEFMQAYRKLAAERPEELARSQRAFIDRTHSGPVLKLAENRGLDVTDPGIQSAMFSQSVQHSRKGNRIIIDRAIGTLPEGASNEQVIEAIYRERGKYANEHIPKDRPQVRRSVQDRYGREVEDAKQLSRMGAQRPQQQDQQPDQPQQQQPDQPQQADEQFTNTALQGAIDVATGYRGNDPDYVPSPWARVTGGAANKTVDVPGEGGQWLNDLNATLEQSYPAQAYDAMVGVVDTTLSYLVGSDKKKAADQFVQGKIAQPIREMLQGRAERNAEDRSARPGNLDESIRDAAGMEKSDATPDLKRFKTPLGRRIGAGKSIGPGSAKRALENEDVANDVRQNMEAPEEFEAAANLSRDLHPMSEGSNTFTVTSTTGRPTNKQIGHAFAMYSAGHITRDEFVRFQSTGTISADGAAQIQTGMQQAAQTLRSQIEQENMNIREQIKGQNKLTEKMVDNQIWDQQDQTTRARDAAAESGSATKTLEHMDTIAPTVFADMDEAQQTKAKQDLFRGAVEWGGELFGTDIDTAKLMHGYTKLAEREPAVQVAWYNIPRYWIDGDRSHALTEDPVAQVLAANGASVFETDAGAQNYARAVQVYNDKMSGRGDLNRARDPKLSAQALVNFDILTRETADVSWDSPKSVEVSDAMDMAIQFAVQGRDIRQYLRAQR